MESGGRKVAEEESVIDRIEGLGQITGGEDGPLRRSPLVEAFGDAVREREEGGDARATGSEAVLMRRARKRLKKLRTNEALKNFRGRTEERDGPVRGGKV